VHRQFANARAIATRTREERAIEQDHRGAIRIERTGRWQRRHATKLDVVIAPAERCGRDGAADGGDEKRLQRAKGEGFGKLILEP